MSHCSTNKIRQQKCDKIVYKDTFSSRGFQPRSHQILGKFGFAAPLGGGEFLCAQCGSVGKPRFHRDMGEIFIISSTCCHPWGTWGDIEAELEGAA